MPNEPLDEHPQDLLATLYARLNAGETQGTLVRALTSIEFDDATARALVDHVVVQRQAGYRLRGARLALLSAPVLAIGIFLFAVVGTSVPTSLSLGLVAAACVLSWGVAQLLMGLVMLWGAPPRSHAQFDEDFPQEP